MPDRLVSAPAAKIAVSLEAAKRHLVIDHAADDTLITLLLEAATTYAERYCNRVFLAQTWQALFPAFPVIDPCADTFLELSRGTLADDAPIVKYLDTAGVEQTLSASVYTVDDASDPGRVRLAPDQEWPSTLARWDAVRVEYVAGYNEDEVPAPIQQAILLLVAQMYENRTPEVTGTIVTPIRFAFEALLDVYRIHAL